MINIKPETALEEITHYEAEKKQKCKEEPSLKVIFFCCVYQCVEINPFSKSESISLMTFTVCNN